MGTFTITGLGLYSGTLTNNFGIWQINLSQAEIAFSQSSYLYTGTPLTPKPTVTLEWYNPDRKCRLYTLLA